MVQKVTCDKNVYTLLLQMAIPKITRCEEQVLLSTGLLEFPLSPLTLQETALLDGPSSPSDCLIPACESLSLAPFTGSVSPKPKFLLSVPATPSDELGSDVPPSHEVPDNIAPKSLAQVDPHWETFPKVKEVTAPATIEFKTFEKEELDPSTGKIVHTRVIYPVITPKEKEKDCISVPPLLEAKGQINSLVPSPLAMNPVYIDGSISTATTPREPPMSRTMPTPTPMPCADQVKPAPAELMRDVADPDDVVSSSPRTPTPPRQTPLTVPCTLPISSPVRDFLSSCEETPESSASTQLSSVSPRPSCYSPLGEGTEGEEGQFDDAEEGEICDPQMLHPSEQLLPPSPSPSPMSSPVPSQVTQLVRHILETKRLASGSGFQAVSPDAVAVSSDAVAVSPDAVAMSPDAVAMSPDAVAVSPDAVAVSPDTVAVSPDAVAVSSDTAAVVVGYPEEQGSNDVTPMDTSTQGETLNALDALPNNEQRTSLPRNTGRGALIKQLFTPHGALAAPRVVCPPLVVRKSAKELTALEPFTLPPLLPRTHIWPMTIDYGCLSSTLLAPSPVDTPDTPIQAALNQVTSPQSKLSTFAADQPDPTELALPKPYSTPLPRTLPVTPVFNEAPVGSPPSPMDLENDLPLNSIPVAEIRNTFLPEDVSLMPVILSGPGLQRSGTAVKLLVSAPKLPQHRYG